MVGSVPSPTCALASVLFPVSLAQDLTFSHLQRGCGYGGWIDFIVCSFLCPERCHYINDHERRNIPKY